MLYTVVFNRFFILPARATRRYGKGPSDANWLLTVLSIGAYDHPPLGHVVRKIKVLCCRSARGKRGLRLRRAIGVHQRAWRRLVNQTAKGFAPFLPA